MTQPRERTVRDRDVVALLAGVVIVVVAANLIAAFVPGIDAILAGVPLVVLILVVVTGVVLFRALTRRDG